MINGEVVKAKREALKLTQAEAAKRAGFNHFQQWSGIERGERKGLRPETLLAVAKVLGCSMEELLAAPPAPSRPAKPRRTRSTGAGGEK